MKYDNAGFYGIKCTPHYAQGMVMLIKVGNATLPDSYRAFTAPGSLISASRISIRVLINSKGERCGGGEQTAG